MKKRCLFMAFLALVFLKGFLLAQEVSLSGFVFDQTKTKVGRDFYEVFARAWEFPSGLEDKNIYITEMTDPRWGSMVIIYVEDSAVYSSMLKPRLEDIEGKVEEALDAVLNYFVYLMEQEERLKEESKFW